MTKSSKKAAKKAASRVRSTGAAAPLDTAARLETMGYRAHCETEAHFPCSTVLVPDIPAARYWADARHRETEHADCVFKLERVLFDKSTYHILSTVAELPYVPVLGPIEWSDEDLYDLGPIWEQTSAEDMKAKGIPSAVINAAVAALAARPAISKEAPEAEEDDEPKAKNGPTEAIGQSHPAPKPENAAAHRPSGHRALKANSAKSRKAIMASPAKKGSLKMNGKNGKPKKRV